MNTRGAADLIQLVLAPTFLGRKTMPAYSSEAQPYLDAIAGGIFASEKVRDWLIKGTP